MLITILSNQDCLIKSILHCSSRYLEDKSKLTYVSRHSYIKPSSKNETNHFVEYPPANKINKIIYKDTTIILTIDAHYEPINCDGMIRWPFIMTLEHESKDILDSFLIESKRIYNKEILDKEKVKNKVTHYLWDEYWEVISKKAHRRLDTLCFSNNIHKELFNDIKTFLSKETEDEFLSYGIPYKFNILLEGYPGTGKSSLIHSIASELDMNLATVSFDKDMNDKCFLRALKKLPENTILVLEDIDTCFKDRTDKGNYVALTLGGLLNTLDGPSSIFKQIIIMTTNYKCNLDSALIRPGRIDKVIHFDYADKRQIELIFNKFIKDTTLFDDFYKEIKNYNLTTAMLQQYLFRYRKSNNLIESISELKTLSKENNYSSSNSHIYA